MTALLPYVEGLAALLALAALFGGVSGVAFVAISMALATSATPAARGLVMGGYSTSLYLGLGLGSFALGPVIAHHGYGAGFVTGAGAGVLGAVLAATLWTRAGTLCGRAGTSTQQGGQHPERHQYGCRGPEQDPLPVPTHTPPVSEVVCQSERHDGHGDQHHLPLRHPGGERSARHAQHSERSDQERSRSEDPQESGRC